MKNIQIVTVVSIFLFALKGQDSIAKSVRNNSIYAEIDLPCSKIGDTLQYIQSIRASKEKYVNKPLSILLNDLKFPVKSYTLGISNIRVTVPGIFLSFNDSETTIDKLERAKGQKNHLLFYITFNPPIDAADVLSKLDTKNSNWGKAQQDYFGKFIVKDF